MTILYSTSPEKLAAMGFASMIPSAVLEVTRAVAAAAPPGPRHADPVRWVQGWTDFRWKRIRVAAIVDPTRSRPLREQLIAAGFVALPKRPFEWPFAHGAGWVWVSSARAAERKVPTAPDDGNIVSLPTRRGRHAVPTATLVDVDIEGGAVVMILRGPHGVSRHRIGRDEARDVSQRLREAGDALRAEDGLRRVAPGLTDASSLTGDAPEKASTEETPARRGVLRIVPPA